ncbi:hypothetical protein BCR34DRAFT_556632 [Clohesyomyces aquaticus]|uniref:DUF3533 domain-containing protein n=1 Tax=Clohesyomyces aquaticus TaxID=1231657 RepID=A0A1Y2A2Z4_9PLEO|nr:hypothetical protein BCR34DRAFT_556632 [Clohesyomyces aquaticus]
MVDFAILSLRKLRQKSTLTNNNRASFTNDEWKGIRIKFIGQTTAGGIAFMLWFLACCSYVYGTLYRSPVRHENFHVLAVDYDRGVVGEAMQAAYEQLRGPSFLSLDFHNQEDFPTEQDMYQSVWRGDYWGAILATEGASDRLEAAIQGGDVAAMYNPTGALRYIWNQQYYTTFANSVVQAGLEQLVAATRVAYTKINGTQAYPFVARNDQAAIQAYLNPINAKATNIKQDPFGSVILFNTISMAMPILQQFFFLLVLNGVSRQHQLYTKMTIISSLNVRRAAGLLFTLGASLCQTGYFWAFKESWDVNGNQFVLTWMAFWLLMHIHYLILDSISTIAPMAVMPFVVLLWVFLNIASSLSPMELQAGFYNWGVALPSYNTYSVLVTIWTGGAHNRLYRALPILFSWWIVANIVTVVTHFRACHLAYKFEREEHVDVTQNLKEDEEVATTSPRQDNDNQISRQTTANVAGLNLMRQRTVEELTMENRQVYGPSIPPLA